MNNTLQKLTTIIQKAVPDIKGAIKYPVPNGGYISHDRPITLEDVLMASRGRLEVDSDGVFYESIGQRGEHGIFDEEVIWKLGKHLHFQKPEVWDFLLSILYEKAH